jgi:hypothetical protein
MRIEKPFAAYPANTSGNRVYIGKASPADRKARNINQGSTAKTTIGGEEGGEETFRNTARGGN